MNKTCLLPTGRSVFALQICTGNVLAFKEYYVKIKGTEFIHIFLVMFLKFLISN